MAKYSVHIRTSAFTSIEFETDLTEPEQIIDAFWETNPETPTLCHQCASDRHTGQNLELGDEWEASVWDGVPTVTKIED